MKTLLLVAGTLAATGIAAQQAPPAAPSARFEVAGQTIQRLADTLSRQLGQPSRDETGINGAYDLTLTFTSDSTGRGMSIGPPPPGIIDRVDQPTED